MFLNLNSHSQGVINVEACLPPAVDCRWGQWEYGSCSVTCGGGIQTGIRRVIIQAENGGTPCVGPSLDERACNQQACDGIMSYIHYFNSKLKITNLYQIKFFIKTADCVWGEWESWSTCGDSCSAADGTGDQTRMREVATEAVNNGAPCIAAEAEETQSCSLECPSKIVLFCCKNYSLAVR